MDRIKQCYSAFGQFGSALRKKYGIGKYVDRMAPALIYGCYDSQVEKVLLKHEGYAVVLWAGSDLLRFSKRADMVQKVKDNPKIAHIARSNFLENTLSKIGIKAFKLPVVPKDNSDIEPKPAGDCIFMYHPTGTKYTGGIYKYLREKLPHIQFLESKGQNDHPREELLKIYEQCFLGLRFTKHDGLSNIVVEMGLMGRPMIWNGDTPNAINFSDKEDVLKKIEELYDNRNNFDYLGLAKEMKEYLDIGDFLSFNYWK